MLRKNTFGHYLVVKKWLIRFAGLLTYRRYNGFNKLKIEGAQYLQGLPDTNVLIVSNHQTYFADVAAMFHVINASVRGGDNSLKGIKYLWKPKLNLYYVAAKETMKSGLLPRILSYAGAVSVERTWRSKGKEVNRKVNPKDLQNIELALSQGWLITFPQGTTRSFKPVRKGTAHLILKSKPIIIPIVIDGFRRSFDRKGVMVKKKGVLQSMVIKKPLEIAFQNDTMDNVVEKLGYAIEQHPSFLKVKQ